MKCIDRESSSKVVFLIKLYFCGKLIKTAGYDQHLMLASVSTYHLYKNRKLNFLISTMSTMEQEGINSCSTSLPHSV